jgi:protein TonB
MEARKSKKANLESNRSIFFLIGVIISLSLVFLAFEWKSYDKSKTDITKSEGKYIMDILPPVTEHKKPEPPRPVIKQVITIKEVDNEFETDNEIVIDQTVDQETPVEFYIPMPEEEPVTEPEIFRIVEEMPEFPGGTTALFQFLSTNLAYPRAAREAQISGKVFVSFVIERDGSLTNLKVLRSPHESLSEEVIRVLSIMPNWSPGMQRGKPVRVSYNLPIDFSLKTY